MVDIGWCNSGSTCTMRSSLSFVYLVCLNKPQRRRGGGDLWSALGCAVCSAEDERGLSAPPGPGSAALASAVAVKKRRSLSRLQKAPVDYLGWERRGGLSGSARVSKAGRPQVTGMSIINTKATVISVCVCV